MGESLYTEQLELFKEQLGTSPGRAYRIFGLSLLYSLDATDVTREKYRLGKNPQTPHEFYNLGVLANWSGNHHDAALLYEKAAAAGEVFPEIFYNLGLTYEKLKKNAKAVEAYQKHCDLAKKLDSEEAKSEVRDIKTHMQELKKK